MFYCMFYITSDRSLKCRWMVKDGVQARIFKPDAVQPLREPVQPGGWTVKSIDSQEKQ